MAHDVMEHDGAWWSHKTLCSELLIQVGYLDVFMRDAKLVEEQEEEEEEAEQEHFQG